MRFTSDFFWKRSPFLRLVCPFTAGIICHFYIQGEFCLYASIAAVAIASAVVCSTMHLYSRFRLQWLNGIFINAFLTAFGALSLLKHQQYLLSALLPAPNDSLLKVAVITEPLVEKANSYKTTAVIKAFRAGKNTHLSRERIILYLQKTGKPDIGFGNVIVFKTPLQPIKHSGNPGAFNFKQYCLFQGIHHQVFLAKNTYQFLPFKHHDPFTSFLVTTRKYILEILRSNISGRKEYGLAEAILIGYKDDLDRELAKSYSETGVMHVIAISGLHLGIIYFILNSLANNFLRNKRMTFLKPALVLSGLWIFSFLTGGSASVLRSALMFTCLLLGNSIGRKSPAINSLASAGFLLLFNNPYLLWDLGFQLSFAAVLSILLFERRLYNLVYFKSKYLDALWKMCSVTLAAQVLTTPLSIFHFHQFPLLFLFTNLIAIPLSSVILFGEILLCAVAFIQPIAAIIGKLIHALIVLMNTIIDFSASIPYSAWTSLQISLVQLVLLYLLIVVLSSGVSGSLRKKAYLCAVAISILLIRINSFKSAVDQRAVLIYQVPRTKAVEFIHGRRFFPLYDSSLHRDPAMQNFHLAPAHILFRIRKTERLRALAGARNLYMFYGKRILVIDRATNLNMIQRGCRFDLIILSGNPAITISDLLNRLQVKLIVIDSSNTEFRAQTWVRQCKYHRQPVYSVNERGAIRINL